MRDAAGRFYLGALPRLSPPAAVARAGGGGWGALAEQGQIVRGRCVGASSGEGRGGEEAAACRRVGEAKIGVLWLSQLMML